MIRFGVVVLCCGFVVCCFVQCSVVWCGMARFTSVKVYSHSDSTFNLRHLRNKALRAFDLKPYLALYRRYSFNPRHSSVAESLAMCVKAFSLKFEQQFKFKLFMLAARVDGLTHRLYNRSSLTNVHEETLSEVSLCE